MTPERLAEITENDRRDRFRGTITASVAADIADHRAELLACVDELRDKLADATKLSADRLAVLDAVADDGAAAMQELAQRRQQAVDADGRALAAETERRGTPWAAEAIAKERR